MLPTTACSLSLSTDTVRYCCNHKFAACMCCNMSLYAGLGYGFDSPSTSGSESDSDDGSSFTESELDHVDIADYVDEEGLSLQQRYPVQWNQVPLNAATGGKASLCNGSSPFSSNPYILCNPHYTLRSQSGRPVVIGGVLPNYKLACRLPCNCSLSLCTADPHLHDRLTYKCFARDGAGLLLQCCMRSDTQKLDMPDLGMPCLHA